MFLDFQGREVKVTVKTEISGVDGKMVGILQGDTGSCCHYCHADRKACNSVIEIIHGFPISISKSYDDCKRVWDELESGQMKFSDPARGGQIHEPLVSCKFFGVLHKELRSLDFIQKIYYRLIAGVYDWNDAKTFISRL